MIVYRSLFSPLALVVGLAWCASSVAQDTGKTQDEALDSLLEKLEKPGQDRKEAREPLRSKQDAAQASSRKNRPPRQSRVPTPSPSPTPRPSRSQ